MERIKVPANNNGLLICFIASFIFYLPNFLYLVPAFDGIRYLYMFYNFIIIFALVSALTHIHLK